MKSTNNNGKSKVFRKAYLNLSYKTFLSIILNVCSHVLYGILLILIIQNSINGVNWNQGGIYVLFISVILLFSTMVYSQILFNVSSNKDILNKGNFDLIKGFYNIKGFKKIHLYILPFIFYLSLYTYLLLLIVPLFYSLPPTFDFSTSFPIAIVFFLVILAPSGIFFMFNRYTALSFFIEVYSEVIVIRKRLKTYYIPVDEIEAVYFTTLHGILISVNFEIKKEKKTIFFRLYYLRNYSEEIWKLLEKKFKKISSRYAIKTRSSRR